MINQLRSNSLILHWVSVLFVLMIAFIALSFGNVSVPFVDVLQLVSGLDGGSSISLKDSVNSTIILEMRLPRVLLAFVAGAGLAICGAALQNLTRNPLADPFLFGIASGAGLGAVLVISGAFGLFGLLTEVVGEQNALSVSSFIGAMVTSILILFVAHKQPRIEMVLLSGVAISFLSSSITSLILYSSDPQAAASYLFWTLGSFGRADWDMLLLPTIVLAIVWVSLMIMNRYTVTLLAGDENATALGVNVAKLRFSILLLTSLLTAVIVANCGAIGFVGLMIPHMVRKLTRRNDTSTLFLIGMFGGGFMIVVDTIARTTLTYSELPVGGITAVIGSIFFFMLMLQKNSR